MRAWPGPTSSRSWRGARDNAPRMSARRAFVFILLLAVPVFAAPKKVDLLITGGTVFTMAGSDIDDGAVAIDHGVIVGVGKRADIAKQFAGKETIKANGNAVLPGFVNTHTHVPMRSE